MVKRQILRVLVADDQSSVRSALRLWLEQAPGVMVVGEAVDTAGLLLKLEEQAVNVLLLDWELPGLPTTPRFLQLLRGQRPFLHIIAMSSRPTARQSALEAGADAFLNKGAPPETVLTVLPQ